MGLSTGTISEFVNIYVVRILMTHQGPVSDTRLLLPDREVLNERRRICDGGTFLRLSIFLVGCIGLSVATAVCMNMKIEPQEGLSKTEMMNTSSNFLETPTTLTVMTLMVWGSPGSFGTEDKEARMKAIGGLPQDHPDVDLFLLTDLWMRPDHDIIGSLIPEEYDITRVNELSLASCDGLIAPEFCSGLAVISKHPFLKVNFYPFDNHGDFFW